MTPSRHPSPSRRSASACVLLMLVLGGASVSHAEVDEPATSAAADGSEALPSDARPDGDTGFEVPQDGPPAQDEPGQPAGSPAGDELPTHGQTQPMGGPTAPTVAEEVDLHEPDLVVRAGQGPLSTAHAEVEGAGHLAAVGELTATTLDADGEERELELLAVDGESFRPLTPDVTAQSPAVWQRLADGDILVRHDIAYHLELELGEHIELRTETGSVRARIGALAANGAPPFAEVIVPRALAAELGQPEVTAAIVAVEDGHGVETVAASLEEVGEVEVRQAPEPEQATVQPVGGPVELESFTYTSRGDGTIAIHGDWVARNIVGVDIPNMGTARCHRAMVPQLYAALQQIIDEGLYDHLQPGQYGGCFSPRHIMFNPNRALSMHAWGLAIDFNVHDNAYGAEPQMDPRIVEIFERWGFDWGGHWSTPDGMHFELRRFIQIE